MALASFVKRFSSTGRRLARKERGYQKAQAHAQIADIESQLAARAQEDPREQSMLKQSMFGRGLGKSTIATQNMKRLTENQARSRAALQRNLDLAHRGLSLIKLRARAARRFLPYDILDEVGSTAAQGAELAAGMGGGGGATGTSGLDEAMWQ